jgi:hypothetical protein
MFCRSFLDMFALKRFLLFTGFLLFFAFNPLESIARAIGSEAKGITTSEAFSIQMADKAVFLCQEQACCLQEPVEEVEERFEDHCRYRPVATAFMVIQPFCSLLFANPITKAVKKTGNNTQRFLIFCNWRL